MVEVRVLWGADVLRVLHLSPPRTVHVGEADLGAAVALPAAQLGARSIPLVLVDAGGVSVIAPGNAAVTIERDGAAASDVVIEPWPEVRGARRIPLSRGVRVIMILPALCTGSIYRAAPDADRGGAPIVLEVALVRAAPVARRTPFAGAGRTFVAASLAGAVIGGALGYARATELPAAEDDTPSAEQRRAMHLALLAVDVREAAAAEPPEGRVLYVDGETGETPFSRWSESGWSSGSWWSAPPRDEREDMPLPALLRDDPAGAAAECWPGPSLLGASPPAASDAFATAFSVLHNGPLGPRLCGIGTRAHLDDDGLRNRPTSLWFAQLAAAQRRVPASDAVTVAPRVRIERLHRGRWSEAEREVDRMVRGRLRDVQACYALGAARGLHLTGPIYLRFQVGIDGAATNPVLLDPGRHPDVEPCAARALDGLRSTPAASGLRTYEYKISLVVGERPSGRR